MTGKLTTHVLDTAEGRPARGVAIELWRVSPSPAAVPIKTATTNTFGRTDEALLEEPELVAGVYELRFAVGRYFTRRAINAGHDLPDPMFLDWIPIRFGVADASAHYHIPLLCSPWSYSTYRGS
ncbi:MAG: hydroxyisourate hydrolase [Leptolyngbyaceae cyanobacterium MO_188.B28]|nr:hydroxyisourate hydrolase [Leptolyngbyaceae cyanobacterium MO_188.B28]